MYGYFWSDGRRSFVILNGIKHIIEKKYETKEHDPELLAQAAKSKINEEMRLVNQLSIGEHCYVGSDCVVRLKD